MQVTISDSAETVAQLSASSLDGLTFVVRAESSGLAARSFHDGQPGATFINDADRPVTVTVTSPGQPADEHVLPPGQSWQDS